MAICFIDQRVGGLESSLDTSPVPGASSRLTYTASKTQSGFQLLYTAIPLGFILRFPN